MRNWKMNYLGVELGGISAIGVKSELQEMGSLG
jgi:hypothetical protein